jgi:hypothetical protein
VALLNKGVRCWFAPHDMPIGGKILDEIDAAIRLRDKLLLIVSGHSIESDWVEDEVTKAFEEERKREQIALFPIRLDNAVLDTKEAWAAKLRARNIGDFTRWKEHSAYQKSFERVLRDLAPKSNDKDRTRRLDVFVNRWSTRSEAGGHSPSIMTISSALAE